MSRKIKNFPPKTDVRATHHGLFNKRRKYNFGRPGVTLARNSLTNKGEARCCLGNFISAVYGRLYLHPHHGLSALVVSHNGNLLIPSDSHERLPKWAYFHCISCYSTPPTLPHLAGQLCRTMKRTRRTHRQRK